MLTKKLRSALSLGLLLYLLGAGPSQGSELTSQPVDEDLLADFQLDYNNAQGNHREVFRRYLEPLGAEVMLHALEQGFPLCHNQAHDLGAEVYAATGDLSLAVEICGDGCTSGCMHGAVKEALGSRPLGEVRRTLRVLCVSDTMAPFAGGNCAHAVGLAAMAASGHELDQALRVCAGHEDPAMQYYCATGVYAEYFIDPQRMDLEVLTNLHFPCDQAASFPAACYRYKAPLMLRALGDDEEALKAECLGLSGAQRLGCFHGMGVALLPTVFDEPARLAEACSEGRKSDRVVCTEGVVEKLADYDQAKAEEACASLSGRLRKNCTLAAKEKMYRLDKPTLRLYIEP